MGTSTCTLREIGISLYTIIDIAQLISISIAFIALSLYGHVVTSIVNEATLDDRLRSLVFDQLPLSGIGYAVGELTISIQFVDITIIVFCNSGIPFIGSHVVVASESHCYQSLVIYVQETCVWINFFYFRQLH